MLHVRQTQIMRNQNESQIIGREGERWFSSLLPPQWSIQRPIDDFGLDGIVTVGTDLKILPLEFGVQIKSSRSFNNVKGCVVVPKISLSMLEYWLMRFMPTLLVAYDSQIKTGYYDWVQNPIAPEELAKRRGEHYLHISRNRQLTSNSWNSIRSELEDYDKDFREAIRLKTEIVPVCRQLSTALSILCSSELIDTSARPGFVEHVTNLSWTYIGIVREIDTLRAAMAPSTNAAKTLSVFREAYGSLCREIILDFEELVSAWGKEVRWIAMKKPNECVATRRRLNAMIADCLMGLLRYA